MLGRGTVEDLGDLCLSLKKVNLLVSHEGWSWLEKVFNLCLLLDSVHMSRGRAGGCVCRG